MSLVNLAHVCSHLQNASLARLGLTSIPYTKWHLSLALLLQKQGFLSQVKLGGPSPPASCFGQGPRDNHASSNFPHGAAGRNPFSPESALALMIRKGLGRDALLEQGFNSEAVEFAEMHGRRSLEELLESGWSEKAVKFINETRAYIEALAEERELAFKDIEAQEAKTLEATLGASPEERRERVTQTLLAQISGAKAETFLKYRDTPAENLDAISFDVSDLEAVAGRRAYKSEQEIRRDGITIEAMGLRIPNQTITLPKEEFQDPDMLEAEGVVTQTNRASRRLWLGMKYYESKPVLSKASMVSKPTKRIWLSNTDLAKVVRGSRAGEVKPMAQIGEIMAVSTDKGIMEARECVERRMGGLVLCRVW